jgi:hypothetical protein
VNCIACHEWLQKSFDGVVADRTDIDRHVRECAECRSTLEAADRLRVGLPRLVSPTPDAAFAARLVAAVHQDRRSRLRRVRLVWAASLAAAAGLLVAVSLRFWPTDRTAPTIPEVTNNDKPTPGENTTDSAKTPAAVSVESTVGSTVASLTSRATTGALEQTTSLLPRVVESPWPDLQLQSSLPSSTLSWRETSHGVSEGLEPMASHARRAVGLLRRDLLPGEMMKPEM